MALTKCSECGAEISDKASACVKCGAPTKALQQPVPVTVVRPPKFKWWLWIPLATFAAFILFGLLIPKKDADANAFARVCRDMFAKGLVLTMYDCNRIEEDIRQGRVVLPDGVDRDAAAAAAVIRETRR